MSSYVFLFSVYYISFFPLWFSVLFIDFTNIFFSKDTNIATEIISIYTILVVLLICLIVLQRKLEKKRSGDNCEKIKLCEVKLNKKIIIEFIFTFVLPLATFDFCTWQGVMLFIFFFFLLFYILISLFNYPMLCSLVFLGYKMYDCKYLDMDKNKHEATFITSQRIRFNENIIVDNISNDFYLVIRKVEQEK